LCMILVTTWLVLVVELSNVRIGTGSERKRPRDSEEDDTYFRLCIEELDVARKYVRVVNKKQGGGVVVRQEEAESWHQFQCL
jgi:hypothetical protein